MKKLLLALVASATVLPAFANDVVASNQFDSTKIVCGGQKLGNTDNINDLKGRCKEFNVKKENVTFFDENSKKVVHCKSDKAGNVSVTECKATNV